MQLTDYVYAANVHASLAVGVSKAGGDDDVLIFAMRLEGHLASLKANLQSQFQCKKLW